MCYFSTRYLGKTWWRASFIKIKKQGKTERKKEKTEEIRHVCIRESVLLRLRLSPTIVSNDEGSSAGSRKPVLESMRTGSSEEYDVTFVKLVRFSEPAQKKQETTIREMNNKHDNYDVATRLPSSDFSCIFPWHFSLSKDNDFVLNILLI